MGHRFLRVLRRPEVDRRKGPHDRPMARALLELASSVRGDFNASIRHLVQCDAELLGVERVTFWSLGDDASSMRCEAGYVVSSRSFERGATLLASDHPLYFEALRDERMLSVEDLVTDPRFLTLREYSAIRGTTSMLNVAVWVDGRLAGVLSHEQIGARRRWSHFEEDFAMGAAQLVASALAARAQTHAETVARRAAFLDEVSRVLLPLLDAREIARHAVELVVPRFADFAIIWGLNRSGELKPFGTTHTVPALRALVEEGARAAIAEGSPPGLSYVMGQGQSLLVADLAPVLLEAFSAAQAALLTRLRVRTVMSVPLAVGDKISGAMSFFATDRHYRDDDLALAEEVGRRVGVALANVHLYDLARQAIRARDEFLMLAAHELRTPLTALQLLAEQPVRRGDGSNEIVTARSVAIARQVRRLGALVEHMLDAAKIRGEGLVLTLEPLDLAVLVRARVSAATEHALRAGCALEIRAEQAVPGQWDRLRMGQLVDHLVDNAIKFGAGQPITVTLERDGDGAVLRVVDRGAGIPADRQPFLFAPFERGVPKEHFGGLGLGLYLAKAIAEAHGGSIGLSTGAQGTTFVVRLPGTPPFTPSDRA
jgi:signal transduction histidine kinase